jgi:formate hydrogenlyase subunit 4
LSDGAAAPSLLGLLLALALAPLAQGLIARTKSVIAGRKGPPLLQVWADVWKLLRKGAVVSDTTTWLFSAGPVVGLAGILTALALLPCMGAPALLAFPGDLILLVLLLALMRFVTVLAALDTGSSFEGMGASREATFSILVEPALLLCLATLTRGTGAWSLSEMLGAPAARAWQVSGPALAMLAVSLFVLLLAENSRIPVDDPNTHLELTMIHEVMVLDHSGPDLAFLEYAAALKLWLFEALLVGIVFPFHTGSLAGDAALFLAGMSAVSIAVGLVESSMARLQLPRVPQLLLGATVLSGFSLILTLR